MYEKNENQVKELSQEEMANLQGGFSIWNTNKFVPNPPNFGGQEFEEVAPSSPGTTH